MISMINQSILNIAYPFAEVGDNAVGGAEQILNSIDKSLTRSKIRSIVLAKNGSTVSGELVSLNINNNLIKQSEKEIIYSNYNKIIQTITQEKSIHLLHFHGLDFMEYIPQTKIPILVTLHLPVSWYNEKSFKIPGIFFNCVSNYQYNDCLNSIKPYTFIENGVNIPQRFVHKKKRIFALSIGRICPEKGYHLAILACKKAKIPFVLAGKTFNYPEHIEYYEQKIKPEIDNMKCNYVGVADFQKKKELFESAICLLVPSLVDETSSLVAMEALAHGVPVIAFRKGALNEIISSGENGYLVNDENEMAEAIKKVINIDSYTCYSIARDRYSEKRMTAQYLQLYDDIIKNVRN